MFSLEDPSAKAEPPTFLFSVERAVARRVPAEVPFFFSVRRAPPRACRSSCCSSRGSRAYQHRALINDAPLQTPRAYANRASLSTARVQRTPPPLRLLPHRGPSEKRSARAENLKALVSRSSYVLPPPMVTPVAADAPMPAMAAGYGQMQAPMPVRASRMDPSRRCPLPFFLSVRRTGSELSSRCLRNATVLGGHLPARQRDLGHNSYRP